MIRIHFSAIHFTRSGAVQDLGVACDPMARLSPEKHHSRVFAAKNDELSPSANAHPDIQKKLRETYGYYGFPTLDSAAAGSDSKTASGIEGYQADNTCCRVHPGNKPKNDAQLYFANISTCCRALQVHEVQPTKPMTFQAAMQIPMNDKIDKAEAWRQLSERDTSLIDVTEYDPFKWWLFLSKLGDKTEKAFGDGITFVQVRKQENRIGLRTEHTDWSVQWVILTAHRNTYKTHLATSFEESHLSAT